MTLFHETWRLRLSLLAAGALAGPEREATRAHVEACPRCREELSGIRAVLALIAADPVREAEPGVPLAALRTRVEARIDALERAGSAAPARAFAWGRLLGPLPAAVAVALALVALPHGPAPLPPPMAPFTTGVPEEMLRRLEVSVARERAARYLNDAQDVLVTVAARPRDCDKGEGRVDMAAEARRSRELLARRALLVEMDRDEVASARPVLEDVERMLREVAALEACARTRDLDAIHSQMEERRLLMKIDLMTRELLG